MIYKCEPNINNSQFDPMVKIVCEVASAHNTIRATHLICECHQMWWQLQIRPTEDLGPLSPPLL